MATKISHKNAFRPRSKHIFYNRANGSISKSLPIDAKIVHKFAKQNADQARNALHVPSIPTPYEFDGKHFSSSGDRGTINSFTMNDYLKFRNWDQEYINNDMTNSLISHAITFPLTLARHADMFTISNYTNIEQERSSFNSFKPKKIRLCCVGSRAESNLPDEYWREFLVAYNLFHKHRGRGDIHSNINWVFDFIGPEVSSRMKSCQIKLPDHATQTSLTMNYHSKYLHDYILELYKTKQHNTKDILEMYDGFVLFNPGCGHPHLEQGWKPSLEFILRTNRSILLTAHSQLDSERDRNALLRLVNRENNGEILQPSDGAGIDEIPDSSPELQYVLNPFASRMSFEDPFPASTESEYKFVRPNYAVLRINRLQGL